MNECKLVQFMTAASAYDGEFHWDAAGMGYVIVLPSGRFLVIDGGKSEDAEPLVRLLESLAEGKPRVAAWILTHPHGDHVDALDRIHGDPSLRSRLEWGLLFANGPTLKDEPMLPERLYRPELEVFSSLLSSFGQDLRIPHAGERFSIDGVGLRFFFTQDEIPFEDDYNKMSMVFSLSLGGETVMFTGDAYREPLRWAAERFGEELRADLCQLAHHGLNGGDREFYRLVGAKKVMIPTSKSGYMAMKTVQNANRFAIDAAESVFLAFEGTKEIPLT